MAFSKIQKFIPINHSSLLKYTTGKMQMLLSRQNTNFSDIFSMKEQIVQTLLKLAVALDTVLSI